MTYSKHIFLLLFIAPLIIFSCKKDHDSPLSEDPSGSGGSSEELVSGFNITGGLSGVFNGDNTIISVNRTPEEGTDISISTTRAGDEDPYWRLDFLVAEGGVESLVPGTYSLGNVDDVNAGNADLIVSFQYHPPGGEMALVWGSLGAANGSLTIATVQHGVFEGGATDRVTGTFEFTAHDSDLGQTNEEDLQDPIVVSNGSFIGKMLVIE